MPSSPEILDGLEAIANGWRALAVGWHVAFAAGLIALGLGWRPARRLVATLLALPLLSVGLLASSSGNPFNGTTFAILTATLVGLARRVPPGPIQIGAPWLVAAGALLTAFGWAYPHFLHTASWTAYLYAAPLGLIPCPTLSAVIGIALVVRGLDSRGWSLTVAGAGALYGLIGWLRLGVTLDAVLLAGAALLAIVAATLLNSATASRRAASDRRAPADRR